MAMMIMVPSRIMNVTLVLALVEFFRVMAAYGLGNNSQARKSEDWGRANLLKGKLYVLGIGEMASEAALQFSDTEDTTNEDC